jgi:NADH-quinone oxidoreductase subunit D
MFYDQVHFDVITGENGDSYDRFLCRVKECRESCKIIDQLLDHLPGGPVQTSNRKVWPPPKNEGKQSMEALIHHFLLFSEGLHAPEGEAYVATEAPKGVLGFYINSKGDTSPWRCRLRSPSFNNLSALDSLVRGHLIADVVTILGSLDIVLGEIDR